MSLNISETIIPTDGRRPLEIYYRDFFNYYRYLSDLNNIF
jgi:hypothetical protein